ncbi:MAG TPA: amidohydrolase [Terriglobales bacterium]
MKLKLAVMFLFAVPFALAQNDQPKPKADAIFIHGNIYTGVGGTSSFGIAQRAQAIAVRGDRIQAVGTDVEISALKGIDTKVVDLGGKFVMPGFNDAHLHLAEGGFQKLTVDMTGVKSLAEFRERLLARVESAAPREWILGGGWDETKWPVKTLPSRWDLDEVTSDHPVFLQRTDGHIAVANTRAMQLASVTLASKDPAGGHIDRDDTGQPTGILRESARDAVTAVIPLPTHDQRRAAIESALQEVAQSGVTSIQDNSLWDDFKIYEELEKEGKLTARISEWLPFKTPLDKLREMRASHPSSDNMLHTGMLKGFMDGSLGSHTAALLEPYADDPKNTGLPQFEQAELNQMTTERLEDGFQIGFHAIGDRGVQMALFAFGEAEKDAQAKKLRAADGSENFRLRIEHTQVTTPAQIAKFKDLKVIASMQPCHLLTDMNWAAARLGPARAEHSYAWAEFLNKGVTLAFGTDFPVEPVTPFRGLYAAVTRKSENGKQEYFPQQKLTMEQAITAYTQGSAYAEFAEKDKGTLVAGKLADFVILDRDLIAVTPDKVLTTKVLRTIVGGKTVYEAK